ncbi:MAG: sulfatase [Thermoguttaceae bacterium]
MRPFAVTCRLLLLLSLFAITLADRAAAADRPPNFVIIFCDDLGYGDVGPFGSTTHRTPNLDRMAAEGIRFTDFYVTSGVCTPSRSSLMTACYPRRVGLDRNETGGWVLFPGNHRGLNPDEITIAEVLKQKDYATAIVGKWHLGDQPEFLPTRQGFDSYFGIPFSNDMGHGHNKRYPPLPLLENEKVFEEEPDQAQLTPRYTARAVEFITTHKDEPFFLYMPHTFPHNPIFASERFAGKSANGNFGDSVEEIDWSVGQILATIKKLGIDEQTLVIFTSDNGAASRWGGGNGPLRGFKGSTWEGGMREPCVMRWPGKIPAGKVCGELASSLDLMPTLAKLAGTSAPTDRVIDGLDIWPLMSGQPGAKSPREAFFYYYTNQLQAVRSGKWKLHLPRKPRGRANQNDQWPQLYDLESDIGEQNNVAAAHPEVVERLSALAEQCREDLGDGDRQGKNCRKPGHVENATTLTHN